VAGVLAKAKCALLNQGAEKIAMAVDGVRDKKSHPEEDEKAAEEA